MSTESGKRAGMRLLPVVLLLWIAAPCRAQISGIPLWNHPVGGTGVEFSADAGFPRDRGTILALRADIGLGALHLSAMTGRLNGGDGPTMRGGTLGLRLLGGGDIPFGINVQAGYSDGDDATSAYTRRTMALGLGFRAPIPGFDLEQWVSPGLRVMDRSGVESGSETNFGVAAGIRATFGLLGVHAGIDRESAGEGKGLTTVGVGVHVGMGLSGL